MGSSVRPGRELGESIACPEEIQVLPAWVELEDVRYT
jgi:hypothetical protein